MHPYNRKATYVRSIDVGRPISEQGTASSQYASSLVPDRSTHAERRVAIGLNVATLTRPTGQLAHTCGRKRITGSHDSPRTNAGMQWQLQRRTA
jgi:hypothetical protein